jgi:hypothetical protein
MAHPMHSELWCPRLMGSGGSLKTTLDHQIDASLQEISKRRKTRMTFVVLGLVVALGTMIGMTVLMCSP